MVGGSTATNHFCHNHQPKMSIIPYNCPNPFTVDVGIISVLGWENSRDIHLAGKPVPEGIVGHLGYPNGKELCPSAPPTCPTVT